MREFSYASVGKERGSHYYVACPAGPLGEHVTLGIVVPGGDVPQARAEACPPHGTHQVPPYSKNMNLPGGQTPSAGGMYDICDLQPQHPIGTTQS